MIKDRWKWANVYCCVPLHHKDSILSDGLKPRNIGGGDAIQIFPSRQQVEQEIKGQVNKLLIIVRTSELDVERMTSVDFNHIFYLGPMPKEAITIVKEKGKGKSIRLKPYTHNKGKFI